MIDKQRIIRVLGALKPTAIIQCKLVLKETFVD